MKKSAAVRFSAFHATHVVGRTPDSLSSSRKRNRNLIWNTMQALSDFDYSDTSGNRQKVSLYLSISVAVTKQAFLRAQVGQEKSVTVRGMHFIMSL